MSIRKSARIFKSLSEDQKQFIDKKTISSGLKVRDWTGFLRKAALYDELRDKAIKSINKYIVICVIVLIASFFLISVNPLLGLSITGISVILLIYFIVQARKISKRDLSDHLRLFMLPFLFVLDNKAGEKTTLQLKMDLSDPLKKKPTKQFEHGGKKIKLFSNQYVMGKIKLLDEAMLEWVLSDDIQQLSYWKTGASGKRKLKSKNKVAHFYFLKISFPKKFYKIRPGAGDSVRISETDEFIVCKLKVKLKSDDPKKVIALEDFLKSLNDLYELIEAKPGTKFPEAVSSKGKAASSTRDDDDDEIMEVEDDYDIVPFMVWHHVYFTDHDYDSFAHEGMYEWDDSEGADSFMDS